MGDVIYMRHWSRHVDGKTPWRMDYTARAHVALNPDGMNTEAVGAALGVSRQRVSQIEHAALGKLLSSCEAHGISREDVREMLSRADRTNAGMLPEERAVGGLPPVRWSPLHREPERADSEHGQRVEAAIAALEAAADRVLARAVELDESTDRLLDEACR